MKCAHCHEEIEYDEGVVDLVLPEQQVEDLLLPELLEWLGVDLGKPRGRRLEAVERRIAPPETAFLLSSERQCSVLLK